jgi:hypothetical protein
VAKLVPVQRRSKARNDPSVLFGSMAPAITWNEATATRRRTAIPTSARRQSATGVFARLVAAIDTFTAEPTTFRGRRDHVVVLGRYGGTIKSSGAKLDALMT